jgi:cell wall-associated NlpC family hydrolase
MGTKVSLNDAKAGDLVFYAKGNTVNHVAIYLGNGQVVHASSPRTGIKISNVGYRTIHSIRNIIGD